MRLVVVGCDAGCGRVSLPAEDLPGARSEARKRGWTCDPLSSQHWCPKHAPEQPEEGPLCDSCGSDMHASDACWHPTTKEH